MNCVYFILKYLTIKEWENKKWNRLYVKSIEHFSCRSYVFWLTLTQKLCN